MIQGKEKESGGKQKARRQEAMQRKTEGTLKFYIWKPKNLLQMY